MTQPIHRTAAQRKHHYLVEKELAKRLLQAPADTRCRLYPELYDELFQKVPDHPQLQRKQDRQDTLREVQLQMRLLQPLLTRSTTYLEVGPGDCAVAVEVAQQVQQVFAVDVSTEISVQTSTPPNFQLLLSNGTDIPVPPDSVHLAYSNQLMEHLHPDDAAAQLANIFRALTPGGRYLCLTPNRISGPHDVSRTFDKVATGFHLKEYTFAEMSRLLRDAGFTNITPLFGVRGRFRPLPPPFLKTLETTLAPLPVRLKQFLGDRPPLRSILGLTIIAEKE